MRIVWKEIGELKPYANNPRHNDESVDEVANSIRQLGFKVPLVITEDGEIITGHTRYKASIKLGLKEVPCIVADDLTEEQIREFRIADNKVSEFATWNWLGLDEELEKINNINMADFGFDVDSIDWDSIKDLTDETYEEPEGKKCECPYCKYIGNKFTFRKV